MAARAVIALARSHGAWGWKVNGAGGEGGSLTLLAGPSAPARRRLVDAIDAGGRGVARHPDALVAGGCAGVGGSGSQTVLPERRL